MIAGVCPAYLPSIQYIAWIVSQQEISFVTNNTYQKQTYRNRAEIYSPNGKLRLSIPVIHKKSSRRQFDYEVSINFENNWQKVHWKSLETSYRSSPYFEFYEDDFYPFYHQKFEKLMDFNIDLIQKILLLIGAEVSILMKEKPTKEFVDLIIAKPEKRKVCPHYQQVFKSKHGFLNDLSVLDLLFNLGPLTLDYLKQIKN